MIQIMYIMYITNYELHKYAYVQIYLSYTSYIFIIHIIIIFTDYLHIIITFTDGSPNPETVCLASQ